MLNWDEIRSNALEFQTRWAGATDERAEAQIFLYEFLRVFGVDPRRTATFERRVPRQGRNGYIDMLWPGKILVEMKSRGRSLDRAYEQAREYAFNIRSDDDLPILVMVCDFERIRLYHQESGQQVEFLTENLVDNVERFSILNDDTADFDATVDRELSTEAAYKMAQLHDLLKSTRYVGHDLEIYLVRLLFCLFAEHSGIFNQRQFSHYIHNSAENGQDLSGRMIQLFDVLNTPLSDRSLALPQELTSFPYINGGLFSEMIRPAAFDQRMRNLLVACCEFDWSSISPSIFGSMFQAVMDPEIRAVLGVQYTSKETIMNVLRPLFLDSLYEELESIGTNQVMLDDFHRKISELTFLDASCGCGNFLMVAYSELRIIELEILRRKYPDVTNLPHGFSLADEIKVNVGQFYGIEIESFPCEIARVGMWLVDQQMNNMAAHEFGRALLHIPLTTSAHIVCANAMDVDWEEIVSAECLSYIIGNPPFAGARSMKPNQKTDLRRVAHEWPHLGDLDYVSGWYICAAKLMSANHRIRTAFISTNSIAQGVHPAILWEPLIIQQEMTIDFAYRSFQWRNEARSMATVHCVIIGFSHRSNQVPKKLFDESGNIVTPPPVNINPYLEENPNYFLYKRETPICNVPRMISGNKPIDAQNYLFTGAEKEAFIAAEPRSARWFRPWYGSNEFLKKAPRFCLLIKDCPPDELARMPLVQQRIDAVRVYRSRSTSQGTRRLANRPTRFHVEAFPEEDYLLVPEVSSEGRDYIPMGFMPPEALCSNLAMLIPGASLYHFGVLTSSLHMAWMRAVSGRLEMRYRYSIEIVYNNFPWPNPSPAQKRSIERAAQAILDMRDKYPQTTYKSLYGRNTMPDDLRQAHISIDRAVKNAYGIAPAATEDEIVQTLLTLYQGIVDQAVQNTQ